MNKKQIKDIFTLYQYELLKETEDYIIFNEGHSMYPGVEIVCLTQFGFDVIASMKTEFSEQGYAVRVCPPSEVERIEDYLFDWFFRVKNTNQAIEERYRLYGEAVINAYGLPEGKHKPYEFVDIPYKVEYDFVRTEAGQKNGLIKSIRNDIDSNGPCLVVVEAAAGFGKTSTAMELLKSYSNVEHKIRPFYMELYKDRQATLFKYLYLAQIHREFQVLIDDKIVEYNIEKGRIPLIIDGFDELLSEDLDSGSVGRAKKKGETMLSTIADLLKGNAKIVLTTRKTAILSDGEFLEWFQNRFGSDSDVHVCRYVLGQPMLENWLNPWQIRLLGKKISGINNPVLLGYLKHLNQSELVKEAKSSSLIESYIRRLLEREIDRQGLTLTVGEQKEVYEWLAAAFAYEDITSESRSNVKDTILLLCSNIITRHETIFKDAQSIANTLTNHALLDRKGGGTIGFVNDFVLGIFLQYAMIDETVNGLSEYYKNISSNFVDKLIFAASSSSKDYRESVWLQLHGFCHDLPIEQWLTIDIKLMNKNMSNYSNLFFDGLNVVDAKFGFNDAQIIGCHFVNFVFENVEFNLQYIRDCTFINCTFNKVTFCGDKREVNDFFNCVEDGKEIILGQDEESETSIPEVKEKDDIMTIALLSHYFQVDGRTRKMKMISKLKIEFNDNKSFKRTFSKLQKNGFIVTNGDKTHITDAGIQFYVDNK